jgi:DNA polymerase III epsilon subunit-like protein
MTKKILTIYTETTGHHTNNDAVVNKKHLYEFARLVKLSYSIKTNDENKSTMISHIIKPHTFNVNSSIQFHNITQDIANEKGISIYEVLNEFITKLKECDVIITFDANHHLKTILAEAVRYNINIDISKYIIIDIKTFFHNYSNISIEDLARNLKIKVISDKVELIYNIFIKLYKQFEDSVKKVEK